MHRVNKVLLISFVAAILTNGCSDNTFGSYDNNSNDISQDDINADEYNAPKLSSDVKNRYLDEINKARTTSRYCGNTYKKAVPKLKWNDKLYKASYEHTYDMTENNIFTHEGSGKATDKTGADLNRKSQQQDRIAHNGYRYRYAGENITGGTDLDSAKKAIQNLLDSPAHCENIMDPDFKEVGLAHIKKSGTRLLNYWTQDFGAPR